MAWAKMRGFGTWPSPLLPSIQPALTSVVGSRVCWPAKRAWDSSDRVSGVGKMASCIPGPSSASHDGAAAQRGGAGRGSEQLDQLAYDCRRTRMRSAGLGSCGEMESIAAVTAGGEGILNYRRDGVAQ